MKTYQRIIALLIVIVTIFSLVACEGEYHYATSTRPNGGNIGGGEGGDGEGGFVPPEMNDDPTDDFTVTLLANGQPYSPRMEMLAYWNDGFSMHVAKFDETGVARIDGLDGDYRVTLSKVPNEYAYDPNTNVATNDDRNIVLNLYTLNTLSGTSMSLYDCYHFSKTGVYCAVIESAEDAIYFQYAPDGSGTYTIESWIDTTADNINPYIEVYGGHSEYKYYIGETDDGGAMGSYTINFVHTVQIAKENISSGGQVTYTFAVKADTKNNKYPVTITFAVKRDGDFELPRPSQGGGNGTIGGMAISNHDFSSYNVQDHEYSSEYKQKYPEYQLGGTGITYVFDENRFKIWKKSDGGDDFYHVYNLEKYPETNGYGPILYANITTATRFIDRAFSQIEYNASGEVINAALSTGSYNYKHFIEGYTALATLGNINGGSYYCESTCPCHMSGNNVGWACVPSCTTCNAGCRRCPEELIGFEGYQAYANSKGLVAVTAELKEFLQSYAKKQLFFNDGIGSLETEITNGRLYQSVGQSGWLFACCYFEK